MTNNTAQILDLLAENQDEIVWLIIHIQEIKDLVGDLDTLKKLVEEREDLDTICDGCHIRRVTTEEYICERCRIEWRFCCSCMNNTKTKRRMHQHYELWRCPDCVD